MNLKMRQRADTLQLFEISCGGANIYSILVRCDNLIIRNKVFSFLSISRKKNVLLKGRLVSRSFSPKQNLVWIGNIILITPFYGPQYVFKWIKELEAQYKAFVIPLAVINNYSFLKYPIFLKLIDICNSYPHNNFIMGVFFKFLVSLYKLSFNYLILVFIINSYKNPTNANIISIN